MDQKLFRKSAIEKLSSPERLDVLMQVTSPAGWLALTALGIVLALVVVWSVVGWIPIKVDGQGILIRGGAVLAVTSDSAGRLNRVLVGPGDVIKAGQKIATIAQDDLALRIQNQKATIADLVRQRGTFNTGNLEAQLRQKLARQRELLAKGLTTSSSVLATQQQLDNLLRQGAGETSNIDGMRRQLRELELQLEAASQVLTPYDGRVIEVVTESGEILQPGSRILSLEELSAPIETMLYISAAEGKKVRPGMEVRVSPTTVKVEEYGFMIGKVAKVSDFPVSPEGLVRVLRNAALAEQLAGKGAPIGISVELIQDKTTPSGFKWSSSKGPPIGVYSGTLCSGAVVVEKKKPIAYVLPIFKSVMGKI